MWREAGAAKAIAHAEAETARAAPRSAAEQAMDAVATTWRAELVIATDLENNEAA
jgi:hypothetical protein